VIEVAFPTPRTRMSSTRILRPGNVKEKLALVLFDKLSNEVSMFRIEHHQQVVGTLVSQIEVDFMLNLSLIMPSVVNAVVTLDFNAVICSVTLFIAVWSSTPDAGSWGS
jgi:hypothetical protein